ncbi:MAG: hypothetical protein NTX64_10095 [Elusimicrobia bacterium]|nr:hypothetical protein [Elusimicrobiota bacterium]
MEIAPTAPSAPILPAVPVAGALSGAGLSISPVSMDLRLSPQPIQLLPVMAAPGAVVLPAATLAAPAAPLATLAQTGRQLTPAQAVAAQARRVERFSKAAAPELATAKDAKAGIESAGNAGSRLFDITAARTEGGEVPVGSPDATSAAPRLRRYAPLLTNVSYADGVAQEQKSLLGESISRRKAGWSQGLKRAGLDLAAGQPAVSVLSAQTKVSKNNPADYTVTYQLEWKYSDTKLGRARVAINSLKLAPSIYALPLPEPPKERQLVVRFNSQAPEADVRALAEQLGLRVLRHDYRGAYSLAAPESTDINAAERKLAESNIVLDARPAVFEVPAENQVRATFKKTASESDITAALRQAGLRVISVDYWGNWTLGAPGADAAKAAKLLQDSRLAVSATPAVSEAPESRRIVVTMRREMAQEGRQVPVTEDQLGDFLSGAGVRVLEDLGGAYVIEVAGDNAAAAKALAAHPLVERAAAVGSITDDRIKASAKGVASQKGRPWSQTEYNASWGYTYDALKRDGATKAQLELFEKLTAEAPVIGGSFNPWSGD